MDTWRTEWFRKKQKIAQSLNNGDCGGSYGEAVIILCATLNALAAEVWPGKKIDRVRFVQLLKEFAPPKLNATQISIPIFVRYLGNQGKERKEEKKFIDDFVILDRIMIQHQNLQ